MLETSYLLQLEPQLREQAQEFRQEQQLELVLESLPGQLVQAQESRPVLERLQAQELEPESLQEPLVLAPGRVLRAHLRRSSGRASRLKSKKMRPI